MGHQAGPCCPAIRVDTSGGASAYHGMSFDSTLGYPGEGPHRLSQRARERARRRLRVTMAILDLDRQVRKSRTELVRLKQEREFARFDHVAASTEWFGRYRDYRREVGTRRATEGLLSRGGMEALHLGLQKALRCAASYLGHDTRSLQLATLDWHGRDQRKDPNWVLRQMEKENTFTAEIQLERERINMRLATRRALMAERRMRQLRGENARLVMQRTEASAVAAALAAFLR